MFASSAPLLIAVRDQVHGLWQKKKKEESAVCRAWGLIGDIAPCSVGLRLPD